VVGAGVAVLCLTPVIVALWPSPRAVAEPVALSRLILASADRPYQGYADTRGEVRLPDLPALGDVADLLGGSTRLRAWYAGPRSWRVAVLERTGERDIYRTADGTYQWNYERNQVVYTPGDLPVRLPWAADLTPPDLARRLLGRAESGDAITSLASRRVAGIVAAGMRLTPADPAATIGRVDVWADPDTGLPLRVEVATRGAATPIFTARFLEVEQRAPDPAVLTPAMADDAAFVLTTPRELARAVGGIVPIPLPSSLAGRQRVGSGLRLSLPGVGAYGSGLSTFVVLAVPRRAVEEAIQAADRRGARLHTFGVGLAHEIRSPLVNAVLAHSVGGRRVFLLAGPVAPEVLVTAAEAVLTWSFPR
jgi:hypothetical protein